MNRFGFHAANKEPTRVDEMCAVGGDNYTVVCADNVPWPGMVERIRQLRPQATILLRPYWGDSSLYDDPVRVTRDAYNKVRQALDFTRHIVIGNEFNVETLPFRDDMRNPHYWKLLNQWIVSSVRELRSLNPSLIIHWPALSPGCGDDPNQMNPPGMELCRESVNLCDRLDVHVYWPEGAALDDYFGLRHKMVRALFPDRRQFWSECGPVDVRRPEAAQEIAQWYARALQDDYWDGCCLFSWNWGAEHPEFNYHDKADLVAALTAMPKEPYAPVPPPMDNRPFVERFPEAFAEWERAGGVEAHFRIHALAIMPTLPVTVEDIEMALGNAKASMKQAQLLMARLKM